VRPLSRRALARQLATEIKAAACKGLGKWWDEQEAAHLGATTPAQQAAAAAPAMALCAGDTTALRKLGAERERVGDVAAAARLYQQAGDVEAAARLYQQAADAGDTIAWRELGALHEQTGHPDAVSRLYQQAADAGDTIARRALQTLLDRHTEVTAAPVNPSAGHRGCPVRQLCARLAELDHYCGLAAGAAYKNGRRIELPSHLPAEKAG
jgi:tetratricopeptide (TPR) repeat protein